MKDGGSLTRVIDDIRIDASKNPLSRLHLVDRRDPHNIIRDFKIAFSTRLRENNAISVRMLVENFAIQESRRSSIIFFKEKGQLCQLGYFTVDDFVICTMSEFQEYMLSLFGIKKICINSMHGLNEYKYELFSIIIVNEYGNGIPCCFFFANRSYSILFSIYFLFNQKTLKKNTY